jgi:hypothetical protein
VHSEGGAENSFRGNSVQAHFSTSVSSVAASLLLQGPVR